VRRPTGTPVRARLAGRGTGPGLLGGKTASLQLQAGIPDSCGVNEYVEHRSCAQHGQPGTAKEAVPSFRPCVCPPEDGRGHEGCIFQGSPLWGAPCACRSGPLGGPLPGADAALGLALLFLQPEAERGQMRPPPEQPKPRPGRQDEAAAAASAQMAAAPGVCPAS
jgi:hypothetical protein